MGLFDKLFTGLSKTRSNLDELEELFRDYAPDSEDFYDDLEELLVLSDVGLPTAEVHLSDVTKREAFRQISYAGMACRKHYIGLGIEGYLRAMEDLASGA